MKKLLFVALIGTFVACGEATEATEPTTEPAVETPVVEAPVDSVAAPVDSTATDTTTAPAQ